MGRSIMSARKPFNLRRELIAWNFCLAAFSILGAYRSMYELVTSAWRHGITYTTCNIENINSVTGTWTWLFTLSKVPELGDTAFIVLRRQRLIFLHWFHHATVLVYTWYSFHDWTATGRWFISMNFAVHAFMYTYYFFRALRFNVPKPIAMSVTAMQLSQMVVGCYVNAKVYFILKENTEHCQVSWQNIQWSFFMYFIYFLLFCHFFARAYLFTKNKKGSMQSEPKRTGQFVDNCDLKHTSSNDVYHQTDSIYALGQKSRSKCSSFKKDLDSELLPDTRNGYLRFPTSQERNLQNGLQIVENDCENFDHLNSKPHID